MKFLALRLDEHNSSVCYTDGIRVKYYKPERHNQIKHYVLLYLQIRFNGLMKKNIDQGIERLLF